MRTRYRITSLFVLGTLLILMISVFLPLSKQSQIGASTNARWNPCVAWVNYGPMHNLIALVWFTAFIGCITQGWRNHPAPRWLAIAGVLAIILSVEDEWWQISSRCYGLPTLTLSALYFSAVLLMFLHHVLQRRGKDQSGRPGRNVKRLITRGIRVGFLLLLSAWFILVQLTLSRGARDSVFSAALIIGTVQRNIALPAFVLFLLTGVAAVFGFRGRQERFTGSKPL